jgi:hypothetical protein
VHPLLGVARTLVESNHGLRLFCASLFSFPLSLKIFAHAVPADTPNYLTMIQYPMDLSKMRRTLIAREYGTLRQLHEDFELMLGNCMKYNQV